MVRSETGANQNIAWIMNRQARRQAKRTRRGVSGRASSALLAAAVSAHESGQFDDAIATYQDVLKREPRNTDAMHFLGLAHDALGQRALGMPMLEKSVRLAPRSAAYRNNLAAVLLKGGEYHNAMEHARVALRLEPDLEAASVNLGIGLSRSGDAEAAQQQHRSTLQRNPQNLDARIGLASALVELDNVEEALAEVNKALAVAHDHSEALRISGQALRSSGKRTEAAQQIYKAVAADPRNTLARVDLANVKRELGLWREAIADFQFAALLQPENPAHRVREALVFPIICESREEIAEARLHSMGLIGELSAEGVEIDDPLNQIGQTSFYMAYHGLNDRVAQEALARFYGQACPALLFEAPHCAAGISSISGNIAQDGSVRGAAEKIRIGIVSRHFGDHATTWTFSRMFRNFPGSEFEFVFLSFGQTFSSDWHDGWAAPGREIKLPPRDLWRAQQIVADAELDVLYYPDIGMEPSTYFLAFARLAPLQIAAGGHPVTTGIQNIDCFVSHDVLEPPGAQAHYNEELIVFPELLHSFPRTMPAEGGDLRQELGLESDEVIYLCPQSLFKFHPDFDALACAILEGDPQGVLVLFEGMFDSWHELLQQRFEKSMPECAGRVHFLTRRAKDNFFSALRDADVILDTVHFGGGNTSYQAMGLGKPVVTLPGEYNRGRATSYFYSLMGIDACVASDEADYVRIALELGRDKVLRQSVGTQIKERSDILFRDAPGADQLAGFISDRLGYRA
jgi:protein O-GlcNAc transferase